MIAPAQLLPQVVRMSPGPMVQIDGLTHDQEYWVRQHLTVANGRKGRVARYGGTDQPDVLCGWTHGPNGSTLIAPGALQGVCRGLRATWPHIRIATAGAWPDYPRVDVPYSGEARPLQAGAVMAGLNYPRGCIVGPCGTGKTDIALQIWKHRGVRALVIVDLDELRDQWCARVLERTGIKAWKFGGGRKERHDNPFCVATYQGLRRNLGAIQRLAQERGLVFVDEAHVTPAGTFLDVLRFMASAWRYGFTATPDREDGLTALMHWWIGPEIALIERSDAEDAGAVMRPDLQVLLTSFTESYDPDDVKDDRRVTEAMYIDRDRLHLIAGSIVAEMKTRAAGLVNCNSVRYCDLIAGEVIRQGVPAAQVAVVTSHTKKKDRRTIFAAVAKGDVRVVICTSLAEKGLDLPILDVCWQATPTSSAVRTEQRWGRACRSVPGKRKPLVIEVVDPHVTRVVEDTGGTRVLRKYVSQFRRRFAAYKGKTDYDERVIRSILRGEFDDPTRTP